MTTCYTRFLFCLSVFQLYWHRHGVVPRVGRAAPCVMTATLIPLRHRASDTASPAPIKTDDSIWPASNIPALGHLRSSTNQTSSPSGSGQVKVIRLISAQSGIPTRVKISMVSRRRRACSVSSTVVPADLHDVLRASRGVRRIGRDDPIHWRRDREALQTHEQVALKAGCSRRSPDCCGSQE
jgi:hypothetical protein